jgi:hypothetical protein
MISRLFASTGRRSPILLRRELDGVNLDLLVRLRSGWWIGWPEFVVALCEDGVMSSTASPEVPVVRGVERVEVNRPGMSGDFPGVRTQLAAVL